MTMIHRLNFVVTPEIMAKVKEIRSRERRSSDSDVCRMLIEEAIEARDRKDNRKFADGEVQR